MLLPADRRRLFSLEIGPLVAAVAGAALFVGGYQLLTGGRFADLWFNVEFSSITYKAGEAAVPAADPSAGVHGRNDPGRGLGLPAAGPSGPTAIPVQAVYLLLATTAALSSAWPLLYPQNFIAPWSGWA